MEKDALREKLRSIGAEAQEVAQHLRDVVFIINPRFDVFSEVQAYYREKAHEFLDDLGLDAQFYFPKPEHNPSEPPEVKRQLFLLLRECLNNIAKHAQATEVHLTFQSRVFGTESLATYFLEVRDNGQGFDLENTRHFSNGLKSMTERAEKIGANLEIKSAPGQGTAIRVEGSL